MKIPNILRVDIVDTEPQNDIGRIMATYYLLEPNMKKLEKIRQKVKTRSDNPNHEATVDCIDEIYEELKRNFKMVTFDTVEIDW